MTFRMSDFENRRWDFAVSGFERNRQAYCAPGASAALRDFAWRNMERYCEQFPRFLKMPTPEASND